MSGHRPRLTISTFTLPGDETDYVIHRQQRLPYRVRRGAAAGTGFPRNTPSREQAPTLADAQEYCRRLARSHYENFSVATWFLPERLRQHFFNVYAYCRISDDLGDEVGDPQASLEMLDQWQAELDACYAGTPAAPGFCRAAKKPCANSIFPSSLLTTC